MHAEARALTLARMLQFGDSTLPIGGFAFSNGLESAVQKGVVHDAATLHAFARTAVAQAARGDGIALVHAHAAAAAHDVATLVAIDRRILARKLSSESRTMSTRMGRKLAALAAQVTGVPWLAAWQAEVESGAAPGTYPVALAVAFAAQDLPAQEAFVVHQYGVAATMLSAALRLMRIGHHETQPMLYALCADVDDAFRQAAAASLDDMAGFAPLTDILSAVHVQAHVRLFMN